MGKAVKIALSIVIALIFLAIFAAGALYAVFDPNDYKPEIAAAVKEKIGRDLILEGELKLAFFPWLGIAAKKVALNNAQGKGSQAFARAEEVAINIEVLPLLAKKIVISRILLKNLVLNLTRNKEGLSNWDDLINIDKPKIAPSQPDLSNKPVSTFLTGAISIENTQINWDNRQTGLRLEIRELNFNTGSFAVNEPVAIALAFRAFFPEAKLTESVKLTTELRVNEKLDHFDVTHCVLDTVSEGETVPGNSVAATLSTAITLDLQKQSVKIAGLELKSSDLIISADLDGYGIKEHPTFQGSVRVKPFNPVKVLKERGLSLPEMKSDHAMNKLSANFDLEATKDLADFKNVLICLDDSQITGLIQIKNFTQPMFGIQLNINHIDLDQYLPTPTNKEKPITSPASALAAAASSVPLETLRKLNINGEVTVRKLKVSDLLMQDIQLKLYGKNATVSRPERGNDR